MRPTSPHPITCPGLLAVVAMLLAGVAPGAAQDTSCTAQRAGQVACIAGRLCTCQLAPASMATRLPDGLRWDCGILRPPCGEAVPATLDPWPNQLPDALAIDRSRTIINPMPPRWGGRPRH